MFFQAVASLLTNSWNFLKGIMIPGLGFSFGTFLLGIAMVLVSIRVLMLVFGFAHSAGSLIGNNYNARLERIDKQNKLRYDVMRHTVAHNVKIAEERRRDTK